MSKNQRVIRVFSVTPGDMLQRPAANRILRSGLMSDPGYGDLYVKINHDLKRVVGRCFVAQVNETSEAGPAEIMFGELLYNNVNKELHLQELYSSARASRNSQKCFEKFLQEAFLLKQSTCLSSL
jgi:hypothetical protein